MTIRVNTYCSTLADTTGRAITFRKAADGTTTSLSATIVGGDTTTYAIQAVVPSGWTDTREGEWTGQAELTFAAAKQYGTPFTLYVEDNPST
jgi:hypothetical protein